jgi:hypothetical protein
MRGTIPTWAAALWRVAPGVASMYSNASFTFAGTIGSRFLAGGIQKSSP